MDSVTLIKLTILMMFLAGRAPKTVCQRFRVPSPPRAPTPLCVSQFALVNHACSRLPYSALPIPPPPSPPTGGDGGERPPHHRHRHGHSHGHGHGHGSGNGDGPDGDVMSVAQDGTAEGECCRWMKAVDNTCVCDLLVQLPAFLSKPLHNYTILIQDHCSLNFQCPGRIRMTTSAAEENTAP